MRAALHFPLACLILAMLLLLPLPTSSWKIKPGYKQQAEALRERIANDPATFISVNVSVSNPSTNLDDWEKCGGKYNVTEMLFKPLRKADLQKRNFIAYRKLFERYDNRPHTLRETVRVVENNFIWAMLQTKVIKQVRRLIKKAGMYKTPWSFMSYLRSLWFNKEQLKGTDNYHFFKNKFELHASKHWFYHYTLEKQGLLVNLGSHRPPAWPGQAKYHKDVIAHFKYSDELKKKKSLVCDHQILIGPVPEWGFATLALCKAFNLDHCF